MMTDILKELSSLNWTHWPIESTHLQNWVFSDQKLKELRQTVYTDAIQNINLANEKSKEKSIPTFPTIEQINVLLEYYAMQILHTFQHKGLRSYTLETACIYFHRFFLQRSALTVDIRLVLFTCILLALKAQDVARHYTLGELLGDLIQDLDISAVFALELPVCEALNFQLFTITTCQPLSFYMDIITVYIKKEYEKSVKSEDSIKRYTQLLTYCKQLYYQSENQCMLMHTSSELIFQYSPSLLALSAILSNPLKKQFQSLEIDIEKVIKHHILDIIQHKRVYIEKSLNMESNSYTNEQIWSHIQTMISTIVSKLPPLYKLYRNLHTEETAESTAHILDQCLDATEIIQNAADGGDRQMRKRQKKSKKQNKDESEDL